MSYGIRRREFDEYLLRRSGARLLEGERTHGLERAGDGGWIVNGQIKARLVVGAGGHFCPVAKLTGAKPARENAVVAQEAEFEMDERQRAGCSVRPEIPGTLLLRRHERLRLVFSQAEFPEHRAGENGSAPAVGTRGGVRAIFEGDRADRVRRSRGAARPRLSVVRGVGAQAGG